MKATLEFDLPEERDAHTLAVRGEDLWCVLWDIAEYLRTEIKYGGHSEEAVEVFDDIRERFHDILDDHNVRLDMVS